MLNGRATFLLKDKFTSEPELRSTQGFWADVPHVFRIHLGSGCILVSCMQFQFVLPSESLLQEDNVCGNISCLFYWSGGKTLLKNCARCSSYEFIVWYPQMIVNFFLNGILVEQHRRKKSLYLSTLNSIFVLY